MKESKINRDCHLFCYRCQGKGENIVSLIGTDTRNTNDYPATGSGMRGWTISFRVLQGDDIGRAHTLSGAATVAFFIDLAVTVHSLAGFNPHPCRRAPHSPFPGASLFVQNARHRTD